MVAQYRTNYQYTVRLEFFSGPLDLLLHLVHQRQVSVGEVNMAEVCEQYLAVVMRAAVLDLDRATEYLVIAATLIAMKSQSLLASEESSEQPEEPYDPRFFEDLRERLKVFEETRRRAERFQNTPQLGLDTFVRGRTEDRQTSDEDFDGRTDASDVAAAFIRLLKRIGTGAAQLRIRLEPLSIVRYMMKVVDAVSAVPRGRFLELVQAFSRTTTSAKGALIGTFIAVLELARRGVITVAQDRESDFELALVSREIGELSSEFDERLAVNDKVVRLDDYRASAEPERREANRG